MVNNHSKNHLHNLPNIRKIIASFGLDYRSKSGKGYLSSVNPQRCNAMFSSTNVLYMSTNMRYRRCEVCVGYLYRWNSSVTIRRKTPTPFIRSHTERLMRIQPESFQKIFTHLETHVLETPYKYI